MAQLLVSVRSVEEAARALAGERPLSTSRSHVLAPLAELTRPSLLKSSISSLAGVPSVPLSESCWTTVLHLLIRPFSLLMCRL